jgi:hypothetical protein
MLPSYRSRPVEAVIWLENYLSKWDRILLLISHSQDFLNNVCTHMIHFTNKGKLAYVSCTYWSDASFPLYLIYVYRVVLNWCSTDSYLFEISTMETTISS